MVSILNSKRARAKNWQQISQACKNEPNLPGVGGPAVSRQIPFNLLQTFRNHRPHSQPLLATKGPKIYFSWMKLLHVIWSPRAVGSYLTLPKCPRPLEKRTDLAAQTAERAVVLLVDSHVLVQRNLRCSRIAFFGQRSLSNMKGQRQQCLKALKSFIKQQATRTRGANSIKQKSSFAEQTKLHKWWSTF